MQYMIQKMSSSKTIPKNYYRKQKVDHPSHEEIRAFTDAAKNNYAQFNHIALDAVEAGDVRINQGVPTGSNTYEI